VDQTPKVTLGQTSFDGLELKRSHSPIQLFLNRQDYRGQHFSLIEVCLRSSGVSTSKSSPIRVS
jgi:hypothetical protein